MTSGSVFADLDLGVNNLPLDNHSFFAEACPSGVGVFDFAAVDVDGFGVVAAATNDDGVAVIVPSVVADDGEVIEVGRVIASVTPAELDGNSVLHHVDRAVAHGEIVVDFDHVVTRFEVAIFDDRSVAAFDPVTVVSGAASVVAKIAIGNHNHISLAAHMEAERVKRGQVLDGQHAAEILKLAVTEGLDAVLAGPGANISPVDHRGHAMLSTDRAIGSRMKGADNAYVSLDGDGPDLFGHIPEMLRRRTLVIESDDAGGGEGKFAFGLVPNGLAGVVRDQIIYRLRMNGREEQGASDSQR